MNQPNVGPSHAHQDRLEWWGGPTTILQHGAIRIITDPMLSSRGPDAFILPKHPSTGEENAHISRYTATPHPSLDGLDAIVVSHPHNDHVDPAAKTLLPKNIPVIIPPAGVEMMRAAGFTDVRALDWGQTLTLESGGTTLTITGAPAHHAHAPALDSFLGKGNGYVFAFAGKGGAYRVFWTGDSVLNEDTGAFVKEHGPFDLVMADLGGVGIDGKIGLRSMTSEEAISLARLVDSKIFVPIHHTSFSHYREPIEALVQRAEEEGMTARFWFPTQGKSITLS